MVAQLPKGLLTDVRNLKTREHHVSLKYTDTPVNFPLDSSYSTKDKGKHFSDFLLGNLKNATFMYLQVGMVYSDFRAKANSPSPPRVSKVT